MGVIQRKNLDQLDEPRAMPNGSGGLIHIGSHTLGYARLEPGWRFSIHMADAMGTTSCPVHHVQILLSGRFAVRMDDGEEVHFEPRDVLDVPPGHDAWVLGDEPAVIIDIAGNVGAMGVPQDVSRFVTTLLMTDIVDSTRVAQRLGDARWKQVLADHHRVVRMWLDRHRGSEVDTTGDGFLAMFSSALGALRAANGIRQAVRQLDLEVRIGVHTGEVEQMGDNIGGIAVHAAARIMSLAGPSEVLVSAATRGLVDGRGLGFEPRGAHAVKGFDRPVEVDALVPEA